jgi:hypothetical protein
VAQPRDLAARFLRALALVLLAFILATALPVLALRWIDPWTSAFMLRERDFTLRYRGSISSPFRRTRRSP